MESFSGTFDAEDETENLISKRLSRRAKENNLSKRIIMIITMGRSLIQIQRIVKRKAQ